MAWGGRVYGSERRITSQMDLMAVLTDGCVAWRLPVAFGFMGLVVMERIYLRDPWICAFIVVACCH